MSTSWSDTVKYKNACIKAVNDDIFFDNFKNNYDYNQILEHVNEEQGLKYLNKIKQYGVSDNRIKQLCNINDEFGGPVKFNYGNDLIASPTSLRYIKVLFDLIIKFGDFPSNLKIVEIGGGYGGQCLITSLLYNNIYWKIFDLDEVNKLQQRYLSKQNIKTYCEFSHKIEECYPDLVISNYAFSEINREIQQEYLDKIIKNAVRGYMIFNNTKEHGNITIEECKEIIKGSQIVNIKPDYPCLIWGKPFKKLIGEL